MENPFRISSKIMYLFWAVMGLLSPFFSVAQWHWGFHHCKKWWGIPVCCLWSRFCARFYLWLLQFGHLASQYGPEWPGHSGLTGNTASFYPSGIRVWYRWGRNATSQLCDFSSLWEGNFMCYFDGLHIFLPFPHYFVPGERTIVSLTVSTVKSLATVPILMTCCTTFGTGKLSLTVDNMVSVHWHLKHRSGLGM